MKTKICFIGLLLTFFTIITVNAKDENSSEKLTSNKAKLYSAELYLIEDGNGESDSSDEDYFILIINGKIYIITPKGLKPIEEIM